MDNFIHYASKILLRVDIWGIWGPACFLYKIWQVFFFCTMPGWPWLSALAPRLGRTSCGDWNWTIFACLLLHSHFYGEGQASLLCLICCWCNNRQSKSVLGVKMYPSETAACHSAPYDPFWTFFNLICWRNLALLRTPNDITFWIGQLKQLSVCDIRPKKENYLILPQWGFCTHLANFSRAARCLAVSTGFFCLLSGLQPSLFANLQMVFFPPT